MNFGGRFRLRALAAAVLLAVSCPITMVEAGASGQEEIGPATEIGSSLGTDSADNYVVQFRSAAALGNVTADLEDQGLATESVSLQGVFVATVEADAQEAKEIRQLPGVLAVEPNQTYTTTADQSSPPWGLDRVDQRGLPLNNSYSYTETGVGVDAYVIDSGLWLSHTEFTGRVPYSAYWNFGDGTASWDCAGHGTHVAGTLGGTTYGLARSASIIPVKVLDCNGNGTTDSVVAGIGWVIDDHVYGTPAVANLSIGGGGSPTLDAAINALIADGVTVVVAAGNNSAPTCNYSPARTPAAITVAASEIDDDDADYSNYGACNDIFAPGSNIQSGYFGSDNASEVLSGTSMASPHVAGAAALILEGSPSATPAQVWTAIDTAATVGAISECCGDPDKLLFIGAPATYVSLSPSRLLDSRLGHATVDGQSAGIGLRPAGSVTQLQVTGRAGVPDGASAVVLNVTVVTAAANGFASVYPCNGGSGVPNSSNLNFWAGATTPNAVVVKVGVGGKVCLFTSAATHLLADINGFYPAATSFVSLSPLRLLDSRPGATTVDGQSAAIGMLSAGSVTELPVTGRAGVPGDASAVVLNVTVAAAVDAGYVSVFPCGAGAPNSSSLNFWVGATIPNAVVVKVGVGGKVCLFTSAATHLLADINGFYPAATSFVSLSPLRLLDSRPGATTVDGQSAAIGLRPAGSITELQVTGRAGVPGDASAVVLNVTVAAAVDAGYVSVFPCTGVPGVPNSSNLNFWVGATIPNAVVVKLGVGGKVCLYTSAATHLLADINGYHPASG